MDKGSEGDEILIFHCRDIGCNIPANVTSIGQLSTESFIEIISKALALISNGEIQVPANLPQNIAVRHRICTDMALKIKELGFLGDCGYNQLLYPVEHQTRDLLKWIVDKLPRSAEEGTEELVGANAILNRNITIALTKWQKALWTLPACQSGKPLTNIYKRIPFSLRDGDHQQVNLAVSILNRHALDKTIEHRQAEALNRRFVKSSGMGGSGNGGSTATGVGSDEQDDAKVFMDRITASLKEATSGGKGGASKKGGSGAGTASGETKDSNLEDDLNNEDDSGKASAQMNLSFPELIKSITDQATHNEATDHFHGSRFAHATVFAQEADDGGINAAVKALGTMQVGGGGVGGGSGFAGNLAAASAALASGTATTTATGAGAAVLDRKAQQELDEKQRQEELRQIRSEIESLATTLETEMKLEEDLLKVMEDTEQSLETLNAEADQLEKDCLLRKKILEMMPTASENILKLQGIVEKSNEKLKQLESEWAAVETPLVTEITRKEHRKTERMNKVSEMIEEIKRYRELMGPMLHDLKERQERAQLLLEERSKLPKNLNRAVYTHRILDITNSLAKQNKEVEKITNDIRDLQKTINLNTNTLQRADGIAEELIFSAASDRNDPVMVDTYRRLKNLRSAFETLLQTVNQIGQTEKQTRDFETKIDAEKNRVASYNFERIQTDLEAITKENQQLLAQLKKLSK